MISDRFSGSNSARRRGAARRLRLPFAVVTMALLLFAAHGQQQRRSARTALAEGEDAFRRGDFGRAADRFQAALEIDPASAAVRQRLVAAVAEISAASLAEASGAVLDAEARAGLLPSSGHPIANEELRQSLATRWSTPIAAGIDTASKALTIDREYEGAMVTLDGWHRLAADLAPSLDEYQRHMTAANEWRHKVLDTRRLKAQRSAP